VKPFNEAPIMSDEQTPSVTEQLSEIATTVTDGVKAATSTVREAIHEGKQPGNVLDVLARLTRQAPLAMLLAAFLVGRHVARRR
jgi:hypothetical protein